MATKKLYDGTDVPIGTLTKQTSAGRFLLDAGEIAIEQEKTAQWVAQTAYRDWRTELTLLEKDLPDWLEYHIEYAHDGVCGDPAQQVIYNRKKALRASEPV